MTAPLDRFSSPTLASSEPATEPLACTPPMSNHSRASSAAPSAHELTAWTGVPDDGVCPMPPTHASTEQVASSTRPAPARADVDAFDVLDAGLQTLATHHPEGDAADFRACYWDGFRKAAADPRLNEALGRLNRAEAQDVLTTKVRERWPKLSKEDAASLTSDLADNIGHGLRQRAAYTMRDTAVRMMRDAAKDFEARAKDAPALRDMLTQLDTLERPGASPEEAMQAVHLREALGLESDATQVGAEELATALRGRAKLMRQEAWDLEGAGEGTIYRSLVDHDVGGVVSREAGIEPGSWAAARLDAVKHEGERQETQREYVHLAAGLTLAFVSGGLGLGGVGAMAAGAASSVALGAGHVAHEWHRVDTARAGESAGTMAAGAARQATVRASKATVELAASTVLAAGAGHALHGSVGRLAAASRAPDLVKGAAHAATHYASEKATHAAVEVAAPYAEPPRASGRHALERLAAAEER